MEDVELRLQPPRPACFFFAIASSLGEYRPEVEQALQAECGALAARSSVYSFSFYSPYYDKEMGGPVWKYLVTLEILRPPDDLVGIKRLTETIENRFSRQTPYGVARTVNLDPGYLNGWQVVLATVKNSSHRIYLSSGVYCELTLRYKHHRFEAMPWTYPDYLSTGVQTFLSSRREEYLAQMKDDSVTAVD